MQQFSIRQHWYIERGRESERVMRIIVVVLNGYPAGCVCVSAYKCVTVHVGVIMHK